MTKVLADISESRIVDKLHFWFGHLLPPLFSTMTIICLLSIQFYTAFFWFSLFLLFGIRKAPLIWERPCSRKGRGGTNWNVWATGSIPKSLASHLHDSHPKILLFWPHPWVFLNAILFNLKCLFYWNSEVKWKGKLYKPSRNALALDKHRVWKTSVSSPLFTESQLLSGWPVGKEYQGIYSYLFPVSLTSQVVSSGCFTACVLCSCLDKCFKGLMFFFSH